MEMNNHQMWANLNYPKQRSFTDVPFTPLAIAVLYLITHLSTKSTFPFLQSSLPIRFIYFEPNLALFCSCSCQVYYTCGSSSLHLGCF